MDCLWSKFLVSTRDSMLVVRSSTLPGHDAPNPFQCLGTTSPCQTLERLFVLPF
jgi:hypothetical protein